MVAANFDRALAFVLGHEGGYSDDPDDSGGTTNRGITIGTARLAGLDLDHDGDVDRADVKLISVKHAARVYRNLYWSTVHGDEMPGGLDLMLFDAAIQHGDTRARRWVQEAAGTHVDGIIGPQTLRAIGRLKAEVLIARVATYRRVLYQAHPKFWKFGKGWSRRLAEVTRLSRELAR
jgi:lysozyme family protein